MADPRTTRAHAQETLLADMTQIARFSAHILRRPLRAYQYQVAAAIVDSVLHQRGLTFAVMMSRQAGKNETSAHIEAFLLNYFRRRGGNIVKVSPTFKPQTINSLLRLQSLFEASHLPPVSTQHGYMVVVDRARASFYSGAPESNVVGATADLLLEADEAQDLDITKWNKAFRPMGASTNVTSVLWGTAWTADTLLAQTIRALQRQEQHDGIRRVFTVPWPAVARELPAYGTYVRNEIHRLGADHPLIRTQYALQELQAHSGMFGPATRALMRGQHPRLRQPVSPGHHLITCDVAGAAEDATADAILAPVSPRRDSTALTVVRVERLQNGLPCYLVQDRYLWTGVPHRDLLPTLVRIDQIWQPTQFIIDATGIGAGLASFLRAELGHRLLPFVFTAQSKSQLGWDLLGLCNSGRLQDHAPDHSPEQAQFWREVLAADYELTNDASRRMRWGVADPTVHDDLLISAALVAAADVQAHAGPSHTVEAPDPLDPAFPNPELPSHPGDVRVARRWGGAEPDQPSLEGLL